MDRVSPAIRSQIMARITSRNTIPELTVRSCLHAAGLRYTLHAINLPGTPDIVFPCRRVCVFVHGCFWHGCKRCKDGARKVRSNRKYWLQKIARNQMRDRRVMRSLRRKGWRVLVIWECEIGDPSNLTRLVKLVRRSKSERRPSSTGERRISTYELNPRLARKI
jgi:DNA mismatch endonuclease (patch repair protein)